MQSVSSERMLQNFYQGAIFMLRNKKSYKKNSSLS